MSTEHNFWSESRAEVDSNRGPSAYQSNAILLAQTASQYHTKIMPVYITTGKDIITFTLHLIRQKAYKHCQHLLTQTQLPSIWSDKKHTNTVSICSYKNIQTLLRNHCAITETWDGFLNFDSQTLLEYFTGQLTNGKTTKLHAQFVAGNTRFSISGSFQSPRVLNQFSCKKTQYRLCRL